jgi:hypothetical protein
MMQQLHVLIAGAEISREHLPTLLSTLISNQANLSSKRTHHLNKLLERGFLRENGLSEPERSIR